MLDAAALDERDYLIDRERLLVGDVEISLTGETRGWIRRLAPPWWRPRVTAGTREAAIRGAHIALLVALVADEVLQWLTRFDRLLWAENKLLQARVASGLGIRTPPTVATSRGWNVPESLGDRIVLKPLGPAHFAEGENERVVYTQAFDRASLDALPLEGAPFVVQSFIPADRHLRAVTVQRRCWVAGLDAAGRPVDWRADENAHGEFKPEDRPGVEEAALRLAQHMGLGYSSQDWIVAGSKSWLLDVNPGGQWLFLPEPIASEVTGAVASWLTGEAV